MATSNNDQKMTLTYLEDVEYLCDDSGTFSPLKDLCVPLICGLLPAVEMATSNIGPLHVSMDTPMPPNTLPLPDGTHERSFFFGHNSPVCTSNDGLSVSVGDFSRAKANFTFVVDRLVADPGWFL